MSKIIFVPGIKGTELYEKENRKWFPRNAKDIESLNITNKLDPVQPIGKLTAFFLARLNIYNALITAFPENQIVPYPYDWRQSILTQVDGLCSLIESASKSISEPVVVVAHSMGGMLAKLALLELDAQGKSNCVRKLITLGTPWLGSPDAYKALLYGEPGIFQDFSEILQFLDDKTTRSLARQYPSVYQLLPQQSYFDDENWEVFGESQDMDTKYNNFMMKVQQIYNAQNKKDEDQTVPNVRDEFLLPLHRKMLQSLPDGIEHDCVIGYGQMTLYSLAEADVENKVKRRVFKPSFKFKNGDGVVPLKSARAPHGGANLYYIEGDHVKLCAIRDSIEFIKWSIAESDSKPSFPLGVIPEDQFIRDDDNLKGGLIATIKCPVDSTILDEEGNYVAGVVDPSVTELSPLATNDSISYYRIGESKYMYIKDGVNTDLIFDINAYSTGVVDVSVEIFDKTDEITKLDFKPIPVSKESSVSLKLPLSSNANEAVISSQKEVRKAEIKKVPKKEKKIVLEPVPELKISFKPSAETKKVPRKDVFSGPIELNIEPEMDQIFYTVNDGRPIHYKKEEILDLPRGSYEIKAYGKDRYDRPTEVASRLVQIDNGAPTTKIHLIIGPDDMQINFHPQTFGVKCDTYYKIDEDKEFNMTESKMIRHSYGKLVNDARSTMTIHYYSSSEFGHSESPVNTLTFGLGFIPVLMWEDHGTRLTPNTIWSNIMKHGDLNIDDFTITLLSKRDTPATADKEIPDNVTGVRFESENIMIDVMYSEKYTLYFSGPLTEVVQIDQDYNFSFQLLTDRSKDYIVHTKPKASLHIIGKRYDNDKNVPLTEKDGIFYGTLKVDESFLENKYKLIITDVKNSNPALREISFVLKEEQ
ncbi:lipase/acyltransferase domain-containing protein [Brevibacillus parabrevis]|uniref:lipase/acyltransferase domain-containing protein n=1 Tax=Brevibacillus parabrevis TaxID=54914 RepID=UPI0023800BD2|nr:alpha/beta hydrolase [Brevibacillus parabrevis]WDV94193.1 alpha/beta hydrolase [Brevibacillus parabrevis]